ncbi:MAG: acylphosphatase [Candidatus Micrarchaeia archaeon]
MAMARLHLRVYGLVQGVFFRASTEDVARGLGLTGWVRNVSDGSVEVIAEGEREALEKLLAWCRKGPPGARVSKVDFEWQAFRGEFADFRTTY